MTVDINFNQSTLTKIAIREYVKNHKDAMSPNDVTDFATIIAKHELAEKAEKIKRKLQD